MSQNWLLVKSSSNQQANCVKYHQLKCPRMKAAETSALIG